MFFLAGMIRMTCFLDTIGNEKRAELCREQDTELFRALSESALKIGASNKCG
jgi:hypothetical protein